MNSHPKAPEHLYSLRYLMRENSSWENFYPENYRNYRIDQFSKDNLTWLLDGADNKYYNRVLDSKVNLVSCAWEFELSACLDSEFPIAHKLQEGLRKYASRFEMNEDIDRPRHLNFYALIPLFLVPQFNSLMNGEDEKVTVFKSLGD